jgi:hypothetical protein
LEEGLNSWVHDVGLKAKSSLCENYTMIGRGDDFYKFLTNNFLKKDLNTKRKRYIKRKHLVKPLL